MSRTKNLPAVAEKSGPPVSMEEILAQRAALDASKAKTLPQGGGGQQLSFRGGVMSWAGKPVGHETNVVVLDWVPERSYYGRPYDPNNTSPPDCYSYDDERPHPKAADPQHENCEECPHNAFGSATQGKGKACKQGARLALIAADTKDLANTGVTTARVSTMNAMKFSDYLSELEAKSLRLAGTVTELTCHPDTKTQYALGFSVAGPYKVPKAGEAAFIALLNKATAEVNRPYPDQQEVEVRQVPQKRGAVRRSRM